MLPDQSSVPHSAHGTSGFLAMRNLSPGCAEGPRRETGAFLTPGDQPGVTRCDLNVWSVVRPQTTGRFCSSACANVFNAGGKPRSRICEACGGAYQACDYRQRFCSRECGQAGRVNRRWPTCRLYWHSCQRCDRGFATGNPRSRFCSDDCAGRRCRCGAPLDPRRRSCVDCVDTARRTGRRSARAARRARERAARRESFSVLAVFERDGWRCHLCGKQVLRSARVPHPKAPTIDHLVPLAAGGDHTRANVATAHFLCNSLRGARGSAQLALIG